MIVDDPDAAFQRAVAAGATFVWPMDDRSYGWRAARIVDPFGHRGEIGKLLPCSSHFAAINAVDDREISTHKSSMNRRPLSVTFISWLLIVAGAVGLAYHASEFTTERPFDVAWVCLVRLLAILSGVYMLRGCNWARWLALAWLAYHVILSGFHSLHELAMHGVLLAVIAYFLCRSAATEYFRAERTGTT